jgi:hypothetical protein
VEPTSLGTLALWATIVKLLKPIAEQNAQRDPDAQSLAPRHTAPTVIPSLAFRLTLLPGHGIERGHFLLHVLAAALGAFRVYIMFFQREN